MYTTLTPTIRAEQSIEQDIYDAAAKGDNEAVEALLKSRPDANVDYQNDVMKNLLSLQSNEV